MRTTASSTIKDLHGDSMTMGAITQMATQATNNMTIFLNHSYRVPEDVFGSVENAAVINRQEFIDLDFDIRVNEANDRALKVYESVKNGTKLGTSIGANVNHWSEDSDTGGWIIDDVQLLEASIVGIPANPRSWVEYAVKSIEDTLEHEDDDAEEDPDAVSTAATTHLVPHWLPSTTTTNASGTTTITWSSPPAKAAEPEEINQPFEVAPDSPDKAAEVNPDAQEAPESDPENAGGDAPDVEEEPDAEQEAEAVLAAANAGLLKDVSSVLIALKGVLVQLAAAREAARVSHEAQIRAEAERDLAGKGLLTAAEIIDIVSGLPMGRKTQFVDAANDFHARLSGVYDEDFMQILKGKQRG